MNDFTQMFKFMLPSYPELTFLDWSLELARTPCGPLGMRQPEVVAPELLLNPLGFRALDGGKP